MLGGKGEWRALFLSAEVHFGEMNSSGDGWWLWLYNGMDALHATELYT